MKVLFYVPISFLDISLDIINVLKKIVELHVLIEITEGSKNENLIDLENLPKQGTFVSPKDLLDTKTNKFFEPYFDGLESINYVVFSKKSLSSSIKISVQLFNYIRKIKPDVIQIEGLIIRSIGLIPTLLLSKKLLISLHDPVPHTGEKDWKLSLTRFLFFNFPIKKSFFFFSDFAKKQFENYYQGISEKKFVIKMNSYSYYSKYEFVKNDNQEYMLFFGRLSPYKGIDTLLLAMEIILEKFPSEKLVIAGKSFNGFRLNEKIINKYKDNIIILNKYITSEDLASLIHKSKFVVCPYLDATQSGVLMTAYARNKPVIATNVGAFPEYIDDGITGVLVPPNNPEKLASAIINVLEKQSFKLMSDEIFLRNSKNLWALNSTVFLDAYEV